MEGRSAFGGGDQGYLRDVQYATTARLDARSFLHRTSATSRAPLAVFAARLIRWPAAAVVLDCGCGTGSFWSNPELPRTLSLTLTDLSPGMVAAATAAARANGFERVRGMDAPAPRSRSGGCRPTSRSVAFRRVGGQWVDDDGLRALLTELRAEPEFDIRWAAHPVAEKRRGTNLLAHPDVGTLDLLVEALEVADDTGQVVVAWLPADDETAARLDELLAPPRLRVIGT